MEIKKIDIGIPEISDIFHISDIHIRTLKRHTEYRQVFKRVQEQIQKHKTDNSIVVITGDIVHSKLEMSPELIVILTDFFNMFTIPTIVILGNHDMNLNNTHRIDAISPILHTISNDNIIFLYENGLYEIGNVIFNHMAVNSKPIDYINGNTIQTDKIKIALHHGAVHTATTDIGYEISNDHVQVSMFDGHDFVLLGDIHKPNQQLQAYSREDDILKPEVRYVGSLCQQNHGEALEHGMLHWKLDDRTIDFIKIENDYGYVTYEIENGKIINAPSAVPNKPRIRLKFKDTSAVQIKKIITILKKHHDVQDVSIQRLTDTYSNVTESDITVGNVRDVEYQNSLITEFIQQKFVDVTDKELDTVRHINRTINSKLPVLDSIRNVTWHPISFEFSNMFSYGKDNKIDFTNLNQVVGLFAPNATGKSSLLDAITYTIFDKCSKTSKARDVLNTKQSSFIGIFKFELNGVIYTIKRQGIKQKSGHVKVFVDFSTDTENLNGDERSDTNNNIRKYLGTYDDFILTAFSLQSDNNNFIEKSQRERKDLLSQFLDITIFEQLYTLANDEIKETAGKLKTIKKDDITNELSSAETAIVELNKTHAELKREYSDLVSNERSLQSELITLIESKKPTVYTGPAIDTLLVTEEKLHNNIEKLTNKIDNLESTLHDIKSKYLELIKLDEYDINEIQIKCDKYDTIFNLYTNLKQKINTQQGIINVLQEKIKQLDTHEFDPNCKYCISNVFVKDALEAKNSIDREIQTLNELQQKCTSYEVELDKLNEFKTKRQEYDALQFEISTTKNTIEKYERDISLFETDLRVNETELETCFNHQEMFNKNKELIEFNLKRDEEIVNKKQLLNNVQHKLETISDNIKRIETSIEVNKVKKDRCLDVFKQYEDLEIEYKSYEYYLKSVKRNGVPYEIISTAIPKIESEINNVLNQIVDFNMVLNTDGKNINGYIIYNDEDFWPLELTSGMERFISSLAIRVALINVSALPRPNFIAIDEGWGALDADHIASVTNLFSYFQNKFDFSIIISHVDSMRDLVDSQLNVDKISGYSQIKS